MPRFALKLIRKRHKNQAKTAVLTCKAVNLRNSTCPTAKNCYFPSMTANHNPKYVTVNQRIGTIELDLPTEYARYAGELRDLIRKEFSYEMIDSLLVDDIQKYIENFLRDKEEEQVDDR